MSDYRPCYAHELVPAKTLIGRKIRLSRILTELPRYYLSDEVLLIQEGTTDPVYYVFALITTLWEIN